jgi:GT2 family glycosyltransferase
VVSSIPVLIIPVLNRYDLLERLVASIDFPVRRMLIIDNGRTLGGVGSPLVDEVFVWRVPDNLGCCTSWNFGIVANQQAPWWLISGNDNVFEPGALATFAAEARRDAVVLSDGVPPWTAFTIGDEVIQKVGLFDDNFHPCYFDDNDYAFRCERLGVDVVQGSAKVAHANSSTIHSDQALFDWNQQVVFPHSGEYHRFKVAQDMVNAGRFDLMRRRRCSFPSTR